MRQELYRWKYGKIAENLVKKLKQRGFGVAVVNDRAELLGMLAEMIPEGSTVSTGGSITLTETGVIELLRSGKYNFLDRSQARTTEERRKIELESLGADVYLCSVNAITEDGRLLLLDANGNRVAAVMFGPRKVILISSVNKVVKDLNEARERLRYISPMNSKRLKLETPCTQTGFCVDCSSPQRICNYLVVVESSHRSPGRISVILATFEEGL